MGLRAALVNDRRTLVAMARRNPLTLAMIVGGMMAVGVWLYGVEGQVRHIERTQTTIEHKLVAQSVCALHPESKLCLRGISRALEACLADLHCSTLLASAPEASQRLQEATRPRVRGGPRHVGHSEQPVSIGAPHSSGEGGGHPGIPVPASGVPPVPEQPAPVTPAPTPPPQTPAPAPPSAPGPPPKPEPQTPGPPANICLNNPLLPACVHVGLGVGTGE